MQRAGYRTCAWCWLPATTNVLGPTGRLFACDFCAHDLILNQDEEGL